MLEQNLAMGAVFVCHTLVTGSESNLGSCDFYQQVAQVMFLGAAFIAEVRGTRNCNSGNARVERPH